MRCDPGSYWIPDDDDPDYYALYAKLRRQLPGFLGPTHGGLRKAFPQFRIAQQVFPQIRFTPPVMLPQYRVAQRALQAHTAWQRRLVPTIPTANLSAAVARAIAPNLPNPTAGFAAAPTASIRPVWATELPLSMLGPTLEALRRVRPSDVEAAAADLEQSTFFADTLAHIREVSRDRPGESYTKVTAFVFASLLAAVAWAATGTTMVLKVETLVAAVLAMMFLVSHYTDSR